MNVLALFLHLVLKYRQRTNVAKEILSTEISYIRDLKVIIGNFLVPLREKRILSESILWSIFYDVESILELNEKILDSLQSLMRTWHYTTSIGQLFIEKVIYFMIA